MFTKSTPEQIEEMRAFYRAGLSMSEISRKCKRDRTTILYHIKKKGDYSPNKKILSRKKQARISIPCLPKIPPKIPPEILPEIPPKKEQNIPQDPKWTLTKWHSLKEWDDSFWVEKRGELWWKKENSGLRVVKPRKNVQPLP